MERNMGMLDRAVRLAVAAIVGLSIYTGWISGGLAILFGVLGVVFVLTSLVGFCPLYRLFGWSTNGHITERHP